MNFSIAGVEKGNVFGWQLAVFRELGWFLC